MFLSVPPGVHRNDGLPSLAADAFFEGHVAALLTELHEATARSRAWPARSPDTLGNLGMSAGNFDGGPGLGSFG